jgi:hypothetical protein
MLDKAVSVAGVADEGLCRSSCPFPLRLAFLGPLVFLFVALPCSRVDLLPGPLLFLSFLFYSRLLFLRCIHSGLIYVLLLVSSR